MQNTLESLSALTPNAVISAWQRQHEQYVWVTGHALNTWREGRHWPFVRTMGQCRNDGSAALTHRLARWPVDPSSISQTAWVGSADIGKQETEWLAVALKQERKSDNRCCLLGGLCPWFLFHLYLFVTLLCIQLPSFASVQLHSTTNFKCFRQCDVTYLHHLSLPTLALSFRHNTESVAISVTSVHWSSLFPFVLGFALLTTMTWLYHVLGPRSFRVAAPQIWNMLSPHLKNSSVSREQFKSSLKTWLFVQAYS